MTSAQRWWRAGGGTALGMFGIEAFGSVVLDQPAHDLTGLYALIAMACFARRAELRP